MYNPYSLHGKTILVTGASSGIGRATAIECSRMGARVQITARNEGRLQETLSLMEGEGHASFVADLQDLGALTDLAAALPPLDGCVNNAGIIKTIPVQFLTAKALDEVLRINTIAPILLTQKLLKAKKIAKGASIVFSSSVAGINNASFGNSLYSASKGAVSAFVRNAALELAAKKIRVNAVCPGMVMTEIFKAGVIAEEQIQEDIKRYPLKRYGHPEEIAHAIIYLLSDASSFVTGTNLVIDGGLTLN